VRCGILLLITIQSFAIADPNYILISPTASDSNFAWYDVNTIGVDGKGWSDNQGYYGRIPQRVKGIVHEAILELGEKSAGLSVRFVTDSNVIAERWKLRNKDLAMPHMSAVGVSGLDLYVLDNGRWRNVGVVCGMWAS
jgi:hypothetical protein